MRLVVFGAGYVGLVTGTGLSDLGHEVLVYDIDPDKIAKLNDGRIPIYEPGLADLVHRNQRGGRLTFASEITAPSTTRTPTSSRSARRRARRRRRPLRRHGRRRHDRKRRQAAGARRREEHRARRHLRRRAGTPRASPNVPLEVVSNPEFLKEGDAVDDFFKPDRVVVGARSEEARQTLRELYAPLQLSGERLVITDPRSSELIKYASNTMLAVRISFMNELSRLCHATGADIHSVRLGVGTDSRIGKKFLYAGPGYGGSCFPKDVQALAALGRSHGVQMRIAEAAHLANEEQAAFCAARREGARRRRRASRSRSGARVQAGDRRHPRVPAVRLAAALLERGAAWSLTIRKRARTSRSSSATSSS